MLQLYNYYRSSASYRVRIALQLKGLEYKEIPVHLLNNGGEQHAAEYHAINPQSLVPTLMNGPKPITQSIAIIEYLDETHPDPALLPSDPYQKALVRAFALAITADIHPLNNLRVLKFLKNDLNLTDEQKNQWYQHWITTGFTALEKSLNSTQHKTDFCFGDSPTMADICLVPQMYNARRFNCDLSAYPTLNKIDAHCQTLSAFMKAQPQES